MVWGFGTYQAIVALYISGALACYILIYIANKKGNVEIDKNYFKISVIGFPSAPGISKPNILAYVGASFTM